MDSKLENVRTILVVERHIDSAVPLQDLIVQSGNRVLTAYSLERALMLANSATLDDAVIDFAFDGADEIVGVLRSRGIPFIFHAGQAAAHKEGIERNKRSDQHTGQRPPPAPRNRRTTIVNDHSISS